MTAMPHGWQFGPEDRRFNVYVLKRNGTPIWVGMGSGLRYEVRSHCSSSAEPAAKRDYILKHLDEITSEIVFADLPWEEGAEKESAPIRPPEDERIPQGRGRRRIPALARSRPCAEAPSPSLAQP
jgi:hypothetical protein